MTTPAEALAVAFDSYSEELDHLADTVRPIWAANGQDVKAALEHVHQSHLNRRMRVLAGLALERLDTVWVAETFANYLAGE